MKKLFLSKKQKIMSNKTILILKFLLPGFTYMIMNEYERLFISPVAFILGMVVTSAVLLVIPLILYSLFYLFTKNKEKSGNIFKRIYDIIFWICMIFLILGRIASYYNEKNLDEFKQTKLYKLSLAIGDTYQGGIIFYLDGNGGGLITAPSDQSGLGGRAEWACDIKLTQIITAAAIGRGSQNTIEIEAGCTTPGTPADICANLILGGYSDWFLPSKDELNEMYKLHKQGLGGFSKNFYWSSTGVDGGAYYWTQEFRFGEQYNNSANTSYYVRAIRAF